MTRRFLLAGRIALTKAKPSQRVVNNNSERGGGMGTGYGVGELSWGGGGCGYCVRPHPPASSITLGISVTGVQSRRTHGAPATQYSLCVNQGGDKQPNPSM